MTNAGPLDIQIDQGSDFELSFQILDNEGDPVSLSGATIRGQIRSTPQSTTVVATFTGIIVSASLGQGKVSLTNGQTASIAVDNSEEDGGRELTTYVYDVEVVFSDGKVQRILQGACFVSPEVTR